jgi:hypothetical protein
MQKSSKILLPFSVLKHRRVLLIFGLNNEETPVFILVLFYLCSIMFADNVHSDESSG